MLLKIIVALSFLSLSQQGKCPFGYDSDDAKPKSHSHPNVTSGTINYPSELFTCPNGAVLTTRFSFSSTTYDNIVNGVIAKYDGMSTQTDKDNMVACLARLAGHDFMDFRNNSGVITGGMDGCMDFNDGPHAGLVDCTTAADIFTVYQSHCDVVSLADFLVIIAEATMLRAASDYNSADPFADGTLGKRFKDAFRPGRTTVEQCSDMTGKMPVAEDGCDSLQIVFIEHVYGRCVLETIIIPDNQFYPEPVQFKDESKAWRLTAAMNGVHTVGQARIRSGFQGFWSDSVNQGIFNNDYFRSLLNKGWIPETSVQGNANRNQWKRGDRNVEAGGHHEMMLNSDLCMLYGGTKFGLTNLNSKQANDCCASVSSDYLMGKSVLNTGDDYCGTTVGGSVRQDCCFDSPLDVTDCNDRNAPDGPAAEAIIEFAQSDKNFFDGFVESWVIATEIGQFDEIITCQPPAPTSSYTGQEEGSSYLRVGTALLYMSLLCLFFIDI